MKIYLEMAANVPYLRFVKQKTNRIFLSLQRVFSSIKKSYKGHELKIISKHFLKTFLRLFSIDNAMLCSNRLAGFVNFSTTNRSGGKGGEQERNFRDERSEYEPKANSFIASIIKENNTENYRNNSGNNSYNFINAYLLFGRYCRGDSCIYY